MDLNGYTFFQRQLIIRTIRSHLEESQKGEKIVKEAKLTLTCI